jgi:hypothetical protein
MNKQVQSTTYYLTIREAGGKLSVDDGAGGSGDLKVRDGDVIQWSNQSGWKCRLKFKKLKLGQNPGYDGDHWPFKVGNGPGFEVDDKQSWNGTIDGPKATNGKKVAYIKYDVNASGVGAPDDLDPMIIVDN